MRFQVLDQFPYRTEALTNEGLRRDGRWAKPHDVVILPVNIGATTDIDRLRLGSGLYLNLPSANTDQLFCFRSRSRDSLI